MKFFIFFIINAYAPGVLAQQLICSSGMDSFSRTLHPLLVQSCTKCHGDGGSEAPHSVTDLKVSYQTSLTLVDFVNTQNSRFYIKALQKHWLNYDQTQSGMNAGDLLNAINEWWDGGQKSCPKNYQLFSASLSVPSDLPEANSQKFKVLTWSLGDLNPALSKCELQIKIQRFTASSGNVPGSFRVREPAIRCTKALHLSRLRIYVNGQTQSYENIYENLEGDVQASEQFQILSRDEMILIEREQSSALQLAIGSLELI